MTNNPCCNICGHSGPFINPDQGKEGWQCGNCGSSSRNRLVILGLGKILGFDDRPLYQWPESKSIRIMEPCPRGPQVAFLRETFDYVMPEFDAEEIRAGAPPEKFADIQHLGFDDGSFDVVIASDVFEHVRDDNSGFREIYRTLKDGGTYLMTVPYDHDRDKNIVRVDTSGNDDIHLLEPRYHGGGGVTLEYRRYGRELLTQLRTAGFSVGYVNAPAPAYQIAPSLLLICQKSAFLDMSRYFETDRASGTYQPLGYLIPNRIFLKYKYNLKGLVQFGREAKRKLFS